MNWISEKSVLSKLLNKKVHLYTVVFALMMGIDMSRTSMAGAEWAVTVNCVGLLFIGVLLGLCTPRRNEFRMNAIWWGTVLLISVAFFIPWHKNRGMLIYLHYFTVVINLLGVGTLCISVIKQKLWNCFRARVKDKTQRIAMLAWCGMSIYMCISPMRSVWQIWFGVMFGFFYMIPLTEKQKNDLSNGILRGIILGYIGLQVWSFGFRPYDRIRYQGAYANANMNGLMLLVTFVALLAKIYEWLYCEKGKRRVWWLCAYITLLGSAMTFMIMSACRTAVYIALLITALWGVVVYVRNYYNGVTHRKNVVRVAVVGVSASLFLWCMFPMCYAAMRYLPCILHHPVWWEGEYHENKVHSFDPWTSDKYVMFGEILRDTKERFPSLIGAIEVEQKGYFLADGGTVKSDVVNTSFMEDSFLGKKGWLQSLGVRGAVYLKYLTNLNFTGHELEEGHFVLSNDYQTLHAQNVWLQIAFYYGIPAGVLLVLITVLLGMIAMKRISDGYNQWGLFSLMVWMVFFGFGALEVVWYPGMMIFFLIFFVQKDLGDQRDAEALQ